MSRNYKFYDSRDPYFVTFTAVDWIDVFTRRIYFDVVIESISYCIKHKGLIVGAWCIMTNHVHLIIRSETTPLQDIVRDLKKFTSKKLIATIKENPQESRKERWMGVFRRAGKANPNNKTYQLWQQHNQPIALSNNKMIDQRINYLHMNPVKAGFVDKPEDWLYSSARNYAGLEGMLNLTWIR